MSFELFVAFFDDGAPAGVSRAAVCAAFGVSSASREETILLKHEGGLAWCHLLLSPLEGDSTKVASFAVIRPFEDAKLYAGLYRAMCLGYGMLTFAGAEAPLICREEAAKHLPADLVADMGKPVVVASHQDLMNVIR